MATVQRVVELLRAEESVVLNLSRSILIKNGKVASGKTVMAMRTKVGSGAASAFMDLLGPEHIFYTLFGRGPGGVPSVKVFEQWVKDKTLDLNPFAVRRNIQDRGTLAKDFGFIDQFEAELIPLLQQRFESEQAANILLRDLTDTLIEIQNGLRR